MSKFNDFMKNGWHPEKEGTTLKGQMKSLVGRGDSKDQRNKDHVSRPLHTLTDPSALPPPPQRRGTGLVPGSAPSSSGGEKRKVVTAPSKYQDPHGPRIQPPARTASVPAQPEEVEAETAPAPPRPYRTNTTGLRTDHLPLPPGRRDGADGRSPPSYSTATNTTRPAPPTLPGRGGNTAAAPSLPPRLPPRGAGDAATTPPSTSPQPTGGGLLNQSAVNRLGAAGVSVPALGIGKDNSGTSSANSRPQQGGSHMNELQNRFARFNASPTPPPQQEQSAPAPSQGTTWAQKQAALKTASQFHKDPSKVSLTDARAAASTANNFRQRHGDQVPAGYGRAQAFNEKHDVTGKLGGFANKFGGVAGHGGQETSTQDTAAVGGKKKPPPPPPPKKKPDLGAVAAAEEADAPPPIPMSTRPNF